MAESPEVNALGGRVILRSDQPRRLATRRAVAKANGQNVEIGFLREVGCRSKGVPRISFLYPMASVGTEETGKCMCQAPGVS